MGKLLTRKAERRLRRILNKTARLCALDDIQRSKQNFDDFGPARKALWWRRSIYSGWAGALRGGA